jgi:hypothetical protein
MLNIQSEHVGSIISQENLHGVTCETKGADGETMIIV